MIHLIAMNAIMQGKSITELVSQNKKGKDVNRMMLLEAIDKKRESVVLGLLEGAHPLYVTVETSRMALNSSNYNHSG